MKNSLTSKEYWEKREAYKLKKGLKDLKKIEKELVDEYKKAMNEIGKEISNLFYKYAKDNNLSYSDAKKYLNSGEFREFKRDLKSYMKLIKETGDEELLLELNTLAMKSRISRLEEMFYQCDKYINKVYEGTNKKLAEVYNGTIKDAYYQTIFDTHKAIGVAASFSYIDNDMIKEILAFPWSGRHYSERLWSNRTKLKNAMVQELTQMIIQGKGVKETSRALSKKLDADYKNCLRLIHTEHSYFMGEATYKAYEELEVDKYQFVATLDKRTSDICQELDGKVFDMKDRIVGVNASPMHPRCRSCEIPYIQDDYSTRFARDSKGKAIEIPSNMTYKEWKEAIDKNNLEEAIKVKNEANKNTIKIKEETNENKKEKTIKNTNIDNKLESNYLTFDDGKKLNQFFGGEKFKDRKNSMEGVWKKQLSDDEKSVIGWYCADGYSDINNYLRKYGDYKYINAELVEDAIKDLDSAISKFELRDNISVYRAINPKAFGGLDADFKKLIGTIYTDKGYMSTSPLLSSSAVNKELLMQIDIPKGKGLGAYINSLSGFKDEEYEFLLAKGTKCEIYDISEIDGKPLIKMKVIKNV